MAISWWPGREPPGSDRAGFQKEPRTRSGGRGDDQTRKSCTRESAHTARARRRRSAVAMVAAVVMARLYGEARVASSFPCRCATSRDALHLSAAGRGRVATKDASRVRGYGPSIVRKPL